ncbi:unnamed protein product [Discosporangium mesarthrocarpum]
MRIPKSAVTNRVVTLFYRLSSHTWVPNTSCMLETIKCSNTRLTRTSSSGRSLLIINMATGVRELWSSMTKR